MSDVLLLPREVRRDIAAGLDAPQARWLVDYYYAVQDYRIQAAGQARAVAQDADQGTVELASHIAGNFEMIEAEIQKALGEYAKTHVPGQWALAQHGIGPVLAAGLLAHIDIEKAPTVGHIWRFAGLDPTVKWGKGEKRPWNASLKVLQWKIGDSFVKQSGSDKCFYGHIYRARKEQEVAFNDAGKFADQAARSLEERKIKDKDLRTCYEAGRLPAGRLDLRARRYAVKLFLSHLHHAMYEDRFGTPPPKPYILTQEGGHAHFIPPPNWPI
jgi:hypothetical protein